MSESADPSARRVPTRIERFLRWATSAGVSTFVQILLVIVFTVTLRSVFWSSALAIVISGQVSFVLHHRFIWHERHPGLKFGKQWLRVVGARWCKFVVVNVASAMLNGLAQKFMTHYVVDFRPLAWLVANALSAPFNFFTLKYVVFVHDDPPI
jgi:putative flippase GtrA